MFNNGNSTNKILLATSFINGTVSLYNPRRSHWTMIVLTFLIFSCVSVNGRKMRTKTVDVMNFRQPDNVDNQYFLHSANESTHHCARECVKGDNRICYYRMVLQNYAVLSAACKDCPNKMEDCFLPQCVTADGFEKGILTVNRRLPGPGIQVCYGDWIVVDVINQMSGEIITIHWHGIYNTRRSYMDGVPYINQCPIPEEGRFRYLFRADHAGTNYWHSHSGVSKLNGIQGGLVVREPLDEDVSSNLYDFDYPAHVIFASDWTHVDADERLPGLRSGDVSQDTTYYIINGLGRCKDSRGILTNTPDEIFHVEKGYRYRFRLIGGVCTQCPARFQIEGHRLIVIATDGEPVKPVIVDAIEFFSGTITTSFRNGNVGFLVKSRALTVSNATNRCIIYSSDRIKFISGERYDFVLHATRDVGNYWVQVRGMDRCYSNDIVQMAILHYEGAERHEPKSPRPSVSNYKFNGVVLNPLNAACLPGENGTCITQLDNALKVPKIIYTLDPDFNIEFRYGLYEPTVKEEFYSDTYDAYVQIGANLTLRPFMNNIQQTMPPSPLATQYKDIPEDVFCPNGTDGFPTCPESSPNICSCVPVIRIPLGCVVQMVLIDTFFDALSHPFHLHGNGFYVISEGYLPKQLMNAKDINGLLRTKRLPFPKYPVLKDTVAIPALGYAVLRFIANNPGFWFFHCHFMYHHIIGMGTIFQVGSLDDQPKVPKGMPKCGEYLPPLNVKYNMKKSKRNKMEESLVDVEC
ncbi:uncharacterized protein [Periplaneta americana]|uniref:uncharacterized protein n=1 Tax=Periplaneta americana TaxID=6978 RepID=UPI0037E81CE1